MFDFGQAVDQDLQRLRVPEPQKSGTLVRLVGLTLETRGIMAPIGASCEVIGQHGNHLWHSLKVGLIGFGDEARERPNRVALHRSGYRLEELGDTQRFRQIRSGW